MIPKPIFIIPIEVTANSNADFSTENEFANTTLQVDEYVSNGVPTELPDSEGVYDGIPIDSYIDKLFNSKVIRYNYFVITFQNGLIHTSLHTSWLSTTTYFNWCGFFDFVSPLIFLFNKEGLNLKS